MQAGDNRFGGIWIFAGDKEILVLPSKVLINFECGCGRVLKLNELLESPLTEIAGDISFFLYGNTARRERSLFKTGRPLCCTSSTFGLAADSIGVSFPPTWFVKTNEIWKYVKQN